MAVQRRNLLELEIITIKEPSFYFKRINPHFDLKLKTSIEKLGILKYPTVRKLNDFNYEVVEGRKIIQALLELGEKTIFVHNIGVITDDEARAVNLMLNFIDYDISHADVAYLIYALSQNVDIDKLCRLLPFSKEDIERFIEISKFDWNQYKQQYTNGQIDMFDVLKEVEKETSGV